MILKKFLLLNGEPGAGGGGAVDRGDELPADKTPPVVDDPLAGDDEAKRLAAELEAKKKAETTETTETDEEKAKKTRRNPIPMDRHEAILAKEREARQALERELAKYQKGAVVAEVNAEITEAEKTLETLEAEYAKLVVDGDAKAAASKMSEIRKTERLITERQSEMKMAAAEARATENARYNIAIERVEEAYPALNPDHADFDDAKFAEVVELKQAYQARGRTPTDALQKAVKLIMGEPKTRAEKAATEVAPRVTEKDVAAERKAAAVAKAVEAEGKTPPSSAKVGLNSDKAGGSIDARAVMKMSQEDFMKLPESELAKMRGDEI